MGPTPPHVSKANGRKSQSSLAQGVVYLSVFLFFLPSEEGAGFII